MLTFRLMLAGSLAQAAAMVAHLQERTLAAERRALADVYALRRGVGPAAVEAVQAAAAGSPRLVRDRTERRVAAAARMLDRGEIDFSGAIDRVVAAEEADWIRVTGMVLDPVHRMPLGALRGPEREAVEARVEERLLARMDAGPEAEVAPPRPLPPQQLSFLPAEDTPTRAEVCATLHPIVAQALGIDAGRPPTTEEQINLMAGRRADGGAVPGRPRKYSSVDLCFSADRDVGLIWAFAPTEAERAMIHQAVRDANDQAMAFVARELGKAREGASEVRTPGHVGWLTYEHFTSRPTLELPVTDARTGESWTELHTLPRVAGDPNLHFHNSMFNWVGCDDGRVGSLYMMQLHGRVHEFGAYFQACVATNLRAIGVDAYLDKQKGSARVRGIGDRVRRAFSKRTEDAHEAAAEWAVREGFIARPEEWGSLSPAQQVAYVKAGAASTRRSKRDDVADFESWRRQAEALGWEWKGAIREDRKQGLARQSTRDDVAYHAAMPFVEALFRSRSVVTSTEIRVAAARGLVASGTARPGDISRVTKLFRERGVMQDGKLTEIWWGDDRGRRECLVTTLLHVEQEREFVGLAGKAAADRTAALPRDVVEAAIARSGLDFSGAHGAQQLEAGRALAYGGRMGAFIGAAGAGKTTILAPLVDAAHAVGRPVFGIAQANRQADDLAGWGGAHIPRDRTMSVTAFLSRVGRGAVTVGPGAIVAVDEVGRLGAREILALARLRERHGFTLWFAGDDKQCQGIEAGPPVELLRRGLGAQAIPEILTTVRQKSQRERDTATMFREGRAVEALERKLADGTLVIVPGGRREAVAATAALWKERMDRNRALDGYSLSASAATNAEARELSVAIRKLRAEAGEVRRLDSEVKVQCTDQTGKDSYTLLVSPGDRLRLYDRVMVYPDPPLTEGRRQKNVQIGNNGTVVEVVSVDAAMLRLRNRDGVEGTVGWNALRDENNHRVRLAYGDVLTIDTAQGITDTEHLAPMVDGSRHVTAFKGYVQNSRGRGGDERNDHRLQATFMVVSEGRETAEIMERRAKGDDRPVTREDVIANVARNLSRQPEKPSALAFVERAVQLRRGAARGMQALMRRFEATEHEGRDRDGFAQEREVLDLGAAAVEIVRREGRARPPVERAAEGAGLGD